jgi:hypothetical protein
MPAYRITFYKELLSSDGHPFHCAQMAIDIGRARTPERAVVAAKRRFERRCGILDWANYADSFELASSPRPAPSPVRRRGARRPLQGGAS